MATKKKSGKPVVIVESPAKARTVGKILGGDFVIEASVGHVRDLPANASEIPATVKKEPWARLGIDIEHDFKPLYVVPKNKRDQIKKLKQLVRDASVVYLATDEDREGESISWHLLQVLEPKGEVRRLVFHEITAPAIKGALEHPRDIDRDLVEAQETRRLVDRLYGYSLSPLLWKKIRPKLSAGRVQSVAVRLVVEREQERMRFRAARYWDLEGRFKKDEQAPFTATLVQVGEQKVATGRDFDPETGQLVSKGGTPPLHLTEQSAHALLARLQDRPATVVSLEQKPYTERPSPPFTTSTLQQEAGKKLRFSAQRTMRAAQRLYENGYITYMRTDSTTLSQEALSAARRLIASDYGEQHVPSEPRIYRTKVKNAQEAHEAIRPAGATFRHPKAVTHELRDDDERKIYELVFRRTVASQMKDARGMRTTLTVGIDDARFVATGRVIEYPGFRLAYVEQEENGDDQDGQGGDRLLPRVAADDPLATEELQPRGHETQPPARLTEATLVKELEARGIGRPSTYASIIETIQQRDYCFKKGSALVPTFTAFAVVGLLRHDSLEHLVDYTFTAKMEDDLDEISNGRSARNDYLRRFYLGNGQLGLRDTLSKVEGEIDPREVCSIRLGEKDDKVVEVRVGRYGPFLSWGDVRVSVPDQTPPDELDLEHALALLQKGEEGPRSLGQDPDTGLEVLVKVGRFGPYFQLGDGADGERPKTASLLRGMEPETVTLDLALQTLALPRVLGTKALPDGGEEEVVAATGRFGPYVKWGKETRSIPADESPLTITLERASELLAQPKQRGRSARGQPKVLREIGQHPEHGTAVRVLDGRYGPYVTDGETNASVPKAESVEELTMGRAVELLAARAARGPSKKKTRKKAATRTTAKKTGKKAAKKSGGRAS